MVYFISGAEIVFVFMVVLLVFGANRIPDIARTLAKGIQQVKTASRDFREEIEKSAEAQGLDTKELQKEVNDIKKELNSLEKKEILKPGQILKRLKLYPKQVM